MAVTSGTLRPSQAVTQHGPGSLVDLPTLSMIVLSADRWEIAHTRRVDEPRLARRLRVETFRRPPFLERSTGVGGLPAQIFPKFLVCPRCRRLAPHTEFEFRSHRSEHVCRSPGCRGQGKALAYPARFMVACPRGHLADFPWHEYVHEPGTTCREELRLTDSGQTGSISDLWVECPRHNARQTLRRAFDGSAALPSCCGLRPWIGDAQTCDEQPRVLLRGASNAYFPVLESALSIPPWSEPTQVALGQYFDQMTKIDSVERMKTWIELTDAPELEEFDVADVYAALEHRRDSADDPPPDLRREEWQALQVEPESIDTRAEFHSRTVDVPPQANAFVERIVLLERLREVRALRGFTRIDPVPDLGDMGEVQAIDSGMAPVTAQRSPNWYPGVDFRGEGLFIQLREDRVSAWEATAAVRKLAARQADAYRGWQQARGLDAREPKTARYILLHTLAHLIIRQLALDCGYSSTALRERIYSSSDDGSPMAGLLIYTATSDSDGSLGGLVEMGRPEDFGPLIDRALQDATRCAGDPFCASGASTADHDALNGAACHACLLISETACEAGNRHLDRAALVRTLRGTDTAFATS